MVGVEERKVGAGQGRGGFHEAEEDVPGEWEGVEVGHGGVVAGVDSVKSSEKGLAQNEVGVRLGEGVMVKE